MQKITTDDLYFEKAIIALGGDIKCRPAIAFKNNIYLSNPLGDLSEPDNFDKLSAFLKSNIEKYIEQSPVIICDKHPGYFSRNLAHEYASKHNIPIKEIQHHAAHIAAVAFEYNLIETPLIGLAFDGTGYGDNGTIWGGEFFTRKISENLKHSGAFEKTTLAGGDNAVKEPWRITLGYLLKNNFPDGMIEKFCATLPVEKERITLFQNSFNRQTKTASSSLGRWFSLFASLCGLCHIEKGEAQAAIALEKAATDFLGKNPALLSELKKKIFPQEKSPDNTVLLGDLVRKFLSENTPDTLSHAFEFHVEIARRSIEYAKQLAINNNSDIIACSGGCFCNNLLRKLFKLFADKNGVKIVFPTNYPCTDESLAIGQLVSANFT